jgi:hypothetical protein
MIKSRRGSRGTSYGKRAGETPAVRKAESNRRKCASAERRVRSLYELASPTVWFAAPCFGRVAARGHHPGPRDVNN